MIIIGIDAHKATHTFVAADELGRKVAEHTFRANSAGHLDAVAWTRTWPERRFAVEDCRHVTRRLERDLLAAGEALVRVPPHLTSPTRRSGREVGKSDPIDALAVARVALREAKLPVAQLDGPAREVRLLTDHRDDMIAERTRIHNRLRWHLHELFPDLNIAPKALSRWIVLDEVDQRLVGVDGAVARICRELIVRCREITKSAAAIAVELRTLTRAQVPSLLALQGCGVLSAGKILGEVGNVDRFHSRAAFARWNGSAPIPASSGKTDRVRLSRGGNRQVNAALHRIAITQLRADGPGKLYIQHRIDAGDTKTEAIRALRRRLSDEVFRRLQHDLALTSIATVEAIAA